MNKHPWLYIVFGVFFLLVPTAIYLAFLVPKMSAEYNALMASGGIIGGAGLYGVEKIPDYIKGSSLYKLAGKSFTLMSVIILVEKFIIQIIGCVATFIVSFIVFKIFMSCYKNAKRRIENGELAREVARAVTESAK